MIVSLAMLGFFQTSIIHGIPAGLFPQSDDVRMLEISKQAGETSWPFVAPKGRLMCVPSLGMKVVMFFPDRGDVLDEMGEPSGVIVSTDPIQLFSDVNGKQHLQADMNIEEKIRRLGPYVTLGKKLCDQPKGTALGPSEL